MTAEERERRLAVTRGWLVKFQALLAALEAPPLGLHPVFWKAERDAVASVIADLRAEVEQLEHAGRQRGIDFPCEGCGATAGNFLDRGFHRCRACGYPGQ